jgi:hypothetical protein
MRVMWVAGIVADGEYSEVENVESKEDGIDG